MSEISYTGNENLLYHVWVNLMSNAIKFSPQSGTVRIRLNEECGHICFVIEDEGPGVSDEAKKHIFDKFYQGDTSHKEEGNGLGLALVKRILSVTDGDISVENRTPEGCRFTVTLNK